jgi:hypothetical protein
MGLDMYLNAKRYLWHREDELIDKISNNFPELGEAKIKQVTAEIGYWRKANAIHKWFVDNVQKGVDDCGYYEVSKEELQALLDIINEVLVNKKKAHELLPSAQGFFFGSDHYDKYYFEDLVSTKELLEKILNDEKLMKEWDFEYHSSW